MKFRHNTYVEIDMVLESNRRSRKPAHRLKAVFEYDLHTFSFDSTICSEFPFAINGTQASEFRFTEAEFSTAFGKLSDADRLNADDTANQVWKN